MPESVHTRNETTLANLRTIARRYLADDGGNFLALFALFIPVMLLALGAATDYISATRREDTINGIADAAALIGTTPQAMKNYNCVSVCPALVTQVTDVFNSQLSSVQGIGTATPTVTIVDTAATPVTRTVTVSWTSTSNNYFAGILGMSTLGIAGQSVAKNSQSPVTLIYMLIDESPSMAFPAQSTGVTTMFGAAVANGIGACAFGCHQSDPNAYKNASLWNPSNVVCNSGASAISNGVFADGSTQFGCVATEGAAGDVVLPVGQTSQTVKGTKYTCNNNGKGVNQKIGTASFINTKYYGAEDNFALSRCLAVQLRVDLVNQAVTSLMTTAPTIAAENNTTYAVDLYTLDLGNNNIPSPYNVTPTTSNVTQPTVVDNGVESIYTWPILLANIDQQTISQMNSDFGLASTAAGTIAPLETNAPGDDDYSYIDATGKAVGGLQDMYKIMPACTNPATCNGGSATGDLPKELLFIVSDGMNDVDGSAPSGTCSAGEQAPHCYYGRPVFAVDQTLNPKTGNSYCTDIKANGIKIAFLYLRYNELNSYADYVTDFEPWQYPSGESGADSIEQAAINCASTGLEFTVDTDTDIQTAMTTLFQKAVETAYLAH
ncbi:MAG: TadE/TadG family type IV pilus assembly protein [Caulobacteraceae bacterium]